VESYVSIIAPSFWCVNHFFLGLVYFTHKAGRSSPPTCGSIFCEGDAAITPATSLTGLQATSTQRGTMHRNCIDRFESSKGRP
jgi:hypothetical protein